MHLRPIAAALVAAGLLAAGCGTGSNGSGGSGAVTAKAQAALEPFLEQVRQAAATGDRDAVEQAVQQLKHEVQLEAKGISTSRQAAIDNAADAVLNDIKASPSPSVSPTPTDTDTNSGPPTPPPTTPPATETPTAPVTVTVSPTVSSLTPSDTASTSGKGGHGND